MSDDVKVALISSGAMLLASSGVWSYILKQHSKNNAATKLIMALAYFKSYEMAFVYVQRGFVTKDELEDFKKYIFDPYKELGGNGVLEKIMNDVMNLQLKFDQSVIAHVPAQMASEIKEHLEIKKESDDER
jgi:hypothetical protein